MIVTIDPLAEKRLWAFIRSLKTEIGGMGYANLDDNNEIHWNETFLIPQEVSSSQVDFEAKNGDQIAIERALADGKLEEPSFVWVSWHSHHTMDAYWSSTDDKRIAAMAKVGVKRLLSFVGTHSGKYEMRMDVFDVQSQGVDIGQVTITNVELESEEAEADDFSKSIKDEIAGNVTEYKWTSGTLYPLPQIKSDSKDSSNETRIREALVIKDLKDEGYNTKDAEDLLGALGVEGVEDLLWNQEQQKLINSHA